ncbi:MAG TPA: hypothetical protein VHY08_28145 [Bacillota bacterium]|nr:hypothetical protein [Bacillota bacterium]
MKYKMTILLIGCMLMIILVGCNVTITPTPRPDPTPTPALYSVSGNVTDPSGGWGVVGATVSFSGGYGSVITDNGYGNWSKTGLSGAVTIIPSKLGFTFDPSFLQVSTATSDISFRMTGFTDNFTNSASGWSTSSGTSEVDVGYQSGEYEIKTNAIKLVPQVYAPFSFSGDYTVQVACRKVSGTVGSYGIIFDYSDGESGENYYYFGVDPFARMYFVWKMAAGLWADIDPVAPAYTTVIKATDTDTNTVKVVKTGAQVELWVNGTYLTTIISDLSVIQVGMATESDGLITSRFDNFQFTGTGLGGSSLRLKTLPKTMDLKGFEISRKK